MRPSTAGATGECVPMYSITTSSRASPGCSTSVAAGQRRVAVATGEHEVVGDDADACRVGPIGVSGPAGPSGASAIWSITGVVPVAVEREPQARHLREPAGGDRGVADRAERR